MRLWAATRRPNFRWIGGLVLSDGTEVGGEICDEVLSAQANWQVSAKAVD
jgi:hypothetical protein